MASGGPGRWVERFDRFRSGRAFAIIGQKQFPNAITIKNPPDILKPFAEAFPPERFLTDDAGLAAYQSDGLTAFEVKPRAVVIPETTDEVVEAVKLCHAAGLPFVARGSGTSLSGGAVPHAEGVVIALGNLDRILGLCPRTRTAVVEPGVINLTLSKAAAEHGLDFAPDPSSGQVCTIGGNVAFNSGGVHCLKYGMTSNHVIGIKAVLADGEVVEMGGTSTETSGPDLHGLFCGSEGLFGIALEITVRLVPRPEMFHTVLATYDSVEQTGDAVSGIIASGLLPGAIEIMDRLAMQAASAAVGIEYPKGAEAALIVELEGTAENVPAEARLLGKLLRRSGPRTINTAADDAERASIWRGRKCAFSAVGRISPDFIVQDGVVPRGRLGEALREIAEIGAAHDVRLANVFHAGDGNLHPLIMYDGRVEGAFERAEACAADIVRMCVRIGGSVTGEHGIGLEKRDLLTEMFGEDDLDLMQRTRRAFDPEEIANRGKMFPSGEAPALGLYGLHPLEKADIISRV